MAGARLSFEERKTVCIHLCIQSVYKVCVHFFGPPVVLYGCATWPLILREEPRLRVFDNRVLRRIFGPKRDEVIGVWRKLHNEGLSDL